MKNSKKISFNLSFLLLIILAMIFFIVFAKQNQHKAVDIVNTPSEQPVEQNQQLEETSTEPAPESESSGITSNVSSLSEDEIKASQKRGLPVLMYHFFYNADAGETGKDNNYMEISSFENQIKYLAENNYYVPTWQEVQGFIAGTNGLPEKSVVLTVDDGDESFFRLAVPILDKYNFKATSFLITSWYGNAVSENNSSMVDFQSHSDNMHISGANGKGSFLTMSYDSACADLEASRSVIGNNCIVFCYPFGHFSEDCKKVLADCNFILAFTTQGGRVFPGADPYELPRVRMSKGISLENFIEKVK